MNPRLLTNGTLYSPYFIFVRCAGVYADIDLLHRLGIYGFKKDSAPSSTKSSIFVTEDREWVHVADDWLYTLWHLATVNAAIPSLAKNHDVFTCSVGDADNSFDFEYFHDGNSVRKYVVEDSEYRRGLVVEDFGSPLPSEAEAMNQPDPLIAVLEIAHSLGINTLHDPTLIRAYTKEHNIRPDR